MVRSALVLFVKDEVQDIVAWIAWHLSLGVDKIFIYDDHSTDGTYELSKLCAKFYNVEVFRTDLKIRHFYWRQADSYKRACRAAIGKFDWISFLDGDEYIALEKEQDLNTYLEKFNDFNGIALSWRIYGSNGRVVKSKAPPYEAYTRHCTKELGDCEIGKVFIRPEAFTFDYGSPHHLTLINECYANALGEKIEFTHGPGHKILWQGACVNHYVIRSMQDFVGKISKRINADMIDSDGYYNHFNKNEIETLPSFELVQKAKEIIDFIKIESVKFFLKEEYAVSLLEKPHSDNKAAVYHVRSDHDAHLLLKKNAILVSQNFHQFYAEDNEVLCVCYPSNPQNAYFFSASKRQIETRSFYFPDDNRLASALLFHMMAVDDRVVFQSPHSEHYMSCLPESAGGRVEINREIPSEWEKFKLEKIEDDHISFFADPSGVHDEESFSDFVQKNHQNLSYGDFLLAWNNLNPQSQNRISSHHLGKMIAWL
ncbi:glycosyltransferase family 2 protein [Acetobacteraceae bacterium]|nr:glycosyltransferase family 2 protein [Acetobacteraceae bacterium]